MARQPGLMLAQELLIRKLVESDLHAGEQLKESVLAKEFGINRPAVREALSQAVGWDVVEYVPYCGYRVKDFTLHDILAWSELREGIEPIAARRLALTRATGVGGMLRALVEEQDQAMAAGNYEVAGKADMRFHMAIVEHCGNQRFASPSNLCYFSVLFRLSVRVCNELFFEILRTEKKYKEHNDSLKDFNDFNNELTRVNHHEILDAILAGNAGIAEERSRYHAGVQSDNIRKVIEFCGNPFTTLQSVYQQAATRKTSRRFIA